MILAGRTCPPDYGLPKELFEAAPCEHCNTLFVAGGLYGNLQAMEALMVLAQKEKDSVVVMNGDIHWFDKTEQDFQKVEEVAQRYLPLIGNVEAELRREDDIGVGCGCAYPDCVSQDTVERSNIIHKELKQSISSRTEWKTLLAERASVAIIEVGKQKVAITHGDEQSLGGWQCSKESLSDPRRKTELARWMQHREIDVLATTHTCEPVALAWEHGAIINNGAAGMPNFQGDLFGLVTRISLSPNEEAIYRGKVGELFVEALPLRYDHGAFLKWFDHLWPFGSPAAISYRERIIEGPEMKIKDAILGRFSICK